MAASSRFEISILKHDEQEIILATHHPAIGELAREKLESLRSRLRDLHGREHTLARHRQREARGKAEPRGNSFSGTAEHATQRKQVFVAAIKRLNKELKRLQKFEARRELGEAARRALALRRAQQFTRPHNDLRPSEGMRSIPNQRRNTKIPPSRIGRVSQANKRAQARRDASRGSS
ncbi:hypothetical protein A4A58_02940 [Tardiphaga robiniae]|nr:hypothetical protein A4A58_02940 [Tardiphaga robiniae]